MRRRIAYAIGLLICLVALSCSSQMIQTGTNTWDIGIRSGVTSHYYSYSGP